MSRTNSDNTFTAQQHALLFTSITKEVIHQIGEKNGHGSLYGKKIIKQKLGSPADVIIENTLADFAEFSSKNHIEIIKKHLVF